MEMDRSEILLIGISLCFIVGGIMFILMILARQMGTFEIPYGPYILLAIAVLIVILAGLIVIFGEDQPEEKKAW
jgi:hypothetical protein